MKKSSATSATPRSTTRAAAAPRVVKTRTSKAVPAAASASSLSDDAIAVRAYEIFVARNGQGGDPVSDWLQAERELRGAE